MNTNKCIDKVLGSNGIYKINDINLLQAKEEQGLSGSTWRMYQTILCFTNKDGIAKVSLKALQAASELKRQTIFKALSALKDKGLLTILDNNKRRFIKDGDVITYCEHNHYKLECIVAMSLNNIDESENDTTCVKREPTMNTKNTKNTVLIKEEKEEKEEINASISIKEREESVGTSDSNNIKRISVDGYDYADIVKLDDIKTALKNTPFSSKYNGPDYRERSKLLNSLVINSVNTMLSTKIKTLEDKTFWTLHKIYSSSNQDPTKLYVSINQYLSDKLDSYLGKKETAEEVTMAQYSQPQAEPELILQECNNNNDNIIPTIDDLLDKVTDSSNPYSNKHNEAYTMISKHLRGIEHDRIDSELSRLYNMPSDDIKKALNIV
jgi:hypothetical protein